VTSLEEQIVEAVKQDGLQELVVRVSRFEADCVTPACWQAIAKYRGRVSGPWGVGIMANPVAAMRRALVAGRNNGIPPEEDIFA